MHARAQQKKSPNWMSLKTTVTSDDEGKYQVMATASGSMFGTCFLALPAIFSTLVHISKQIRCRTQSSSRLALSVTSHTAGTAHDRKEHQDMGARDRSTAESRPFVSITSHF